MTTETVFRIWRTHIAHYFNVPTDAVTLAFDGDSNNVLVTLQGNAHTYTFDTGHDDYEQNVFCRNQRAFVIRPTRAERALIDIANADLLEDRREYEPDQLERMHNLTRLEAIELYNLIQREFTA